MRTYMERIDPAVEMARFYAITVQPTLFGDWAVIREWGRIGQGGTVRQEICVTEHDATIIATETLTRKLRRGYRTRN